MDLKKYHIFTLIADYGNLTRVAEETGYTQSGISNIVKTLEEEVGFPLLRRHRRGVELTAEAERLVPVMRSLVGGSEQFEQIVAEINRLDIGSVRVASITSVSVHWMPRILKRFRSDYPAIRVRLHASGDRDVIKRVNDGSADVGFCCEQPEESFVWIPLVEDEWLAILPLGHPMASEDVFPLARFEQEPFIMLAEDYHYETKRFFDRHHIAPNTRLATTDDHTIMAMVEEGLGLSMQTRVVMRDYPHRKLKMLKLDPPFMRKLGIALKSEESLSPAARKFVETAKKIMKD